MTQPTDQEFRTFFIDAEPGLRRALVAALGAQRGRDAAADALAWAWENWDKVKGLDNPVGYLYRVGQSKSRTRKVPMIAAVQTWEDPLVEPELPVALQNLTEAQRLAVVLVHAYGWTLKEVAELYGDLDLDRPDAPSSAVSRSSVALWPLRWIAVRDLAAKIRQLIDGSAPPISLEEVQGRIRRYDDFDSASARIRDLIDGSAPPISFEEVQARITVPHAAPLRRPRLQRRMVLAVVPVVIALVATVALVAPSSSPPAAAAVLQQASTVASGLQPTAQPGPGQYLYYSNTRNVLGSAPVASAASTPLQMVMTTQTWVATDGSGRQVVTYGPWTTLLPSDYASWVAAGSPQPSHPASSDTTFPTSTPPSQGGPFTTSASGQVQLAYPAIPSMPTDAGSLQTYLASNLGTGNGAASIFQVAGELLQEGVSPQVRSALFLIIRSLPGINLVANAVNQSGQQGVGVSLQSDGKNYTLLFNPGTSQVYGLTTTALQPDAEGQATVPAGTTIGYINLGTPSVVNSTSQTPASAG